MYERIKYKNREYSRGYGDKTNKVYLFVHGKLTEEDGKAFAEIVV